MMAGEQQLTENRSRPIVVVMRWEIMGFRLDLAVEMWGLLAVND